MRFFDGYILNTVLLLFPLFLYLICISYQRNNNKILINRYFEFSLLLSLFLLTRYGYLKNDCYVSILLNIPLLFAYLKGRKAIAVVISIILVIYSMIMFRYSPILVIFEYVTYFLIYIISYRKNITSSYIINSFTVLKAFNISFLTFFFISPLNNIWFNLLKIILTISIFYIASSFYYKLVQKIEDFISLNSAIRELEKEKTIRNSLFKITHEIKNPIAVCKGYLDMINIDNRAKLEKYIPIIKSEINRTLSLMDDYLDYSKVKIEKDIIDIVMLLEDFTRSIGILLKDNDIEMNLDIMDDEVYIMADYNRLKQVLINIVKNSMEAKIDGQKLAISISMKVIDNKIVIVISDNGIGMTSEELNHLGEAFYTTKFNGTGIGVNLSFDVINRHNGVLKYESEKYNGTSVTIELPYDAELNTI